MKIRIYLLLLLATTLSLFSRCKKLTDAGIPKNQLIAGKVFSDSTTTLSALVNIYALFPNTVDAIYNPNMALYADETNYSSTPIQTVEFFKGTVTVSNTADLALWSNLYYIIYSSNDLINGLQSSSNIADNTVKQYIAEAKFLRAYAYFYLTNLYGAVPLVLTTDVHETAVAARADSATVYQKIIQDLTDAKNNLGTNYPGGQKIRANQYSALAMLARVYLYQKNWPAAESAATAVLGSGLYTPLESPGNVFLANSTESILQFGTQNGYALATATIIPRTGKPTYTISPTLMNSFETGDSRKTTWIGSSTVSGTKYYYPYKYHNRVANSSASENLVALRAGELYLIRAEARAMQNNLAGAQSDLNIIRTRAGLPNSTANTTPTILSAITHERQVELFNEWGHRFFDLKRSGRANTVLSSLKSTWISGTSLLLPIPQYEITHNVNLSQNPGY